MIFLESLLDVVNRVSQHKGYAVRLRFVGRKRDLRWRVPGVRFLPFILGKRGAVHHPIVIAFKSDSTRREIAEDGSAGRTACTEYGIVSLERSLPVWQNQQRRSVPTQSCHLQISRILADVRIVKRADGVSLIERTIVQHVVED